MKKALITGITGQDGSYLSKLLLSKGYIVYGIIRKASTFNTERIEDIYQDPHQASARLKLYYGDLTDSMSLMTIIKDCQPDEIYNLGAMSHVRVSFDQPEYTANVDALGVLRLLEVVRALNLHNKVKIYQATSSEIFGEYKNEPFNEDSLIRPRSPYGLSKMFGYWAIRNYRESYNFFAVNGILFNHESPVRGETFITRKITRGAVRIALGKEDCIYVGNLNAYRDWGHAKDYVEAMWLMLQHDTPEDFVIATGEAINVRELIERVFALLNVVLEWVGTGLSQVARIKHIGRDNDHMKVGQVVIRIDKRYFRPNEVDYLVGDSSKARNHLGWKPKYTLNMMLEEMINSDYRNEQKQ